MMATVLFICLALVVYAYLGYPVVLMAMAAIHRMICRTPVPMDVPEPGVTLFIPAYNEIDFLEPKLENNRQLRYPSDKLKVVWITDGSDDGSAEKLGSVPGVNVIHRNERRGKVDAMNHGMQVADTPVIVFTDANTMLNPLAIHNLVARFADARTGCVTGEKRIRGDVLEKAVGAGEGLYWKIESWIKQLESETGSTMGAVGELFAFRRELYVPVAEDTLLDDFTISLSIAQKGFRIKYAPDAWGTETASLSVSEEMKRKIRIAAGGWQVLFRNPSLLNPFRFGGLTFKFISHKVLRWTLVPLCFPLLFIVNAFLVFQEASTDFYRILFLLQCLFYFLVAAGALLHNVRLRFKVIFAPYYLMVMNYAILTGMIRYLRGSFSVKWEKARRA